MKKYIFLTILTSIFLVFSYGQKPTLELTFTAVNEGQYVPIDSIFIENLTQGGDTILNAPDTTLILDYITSIGDNTYQKSKFSVSQNYPNPYNGKTTIELYLPEDEYVIITVQNIVGRELVQYSNTLRRGSHSFEFHSGNEKIYLFTATGKSDKETIKMISGISSSIFNSQCNLVYNGHTSQVISLKIQNSLSNFVFNLGDQLRYTGYAQTLSAINGSDTIVDIPMTNEMYEFNISAINLEIPTVTTDSATFITQSSATSGGDVTSDGGAAVTARGVCWSISSNPTLADDYTIDGSGLGSFVSSITGLTSNTTYYVRAYATNTVGTAYGDELSFTTLPPVLPIVTTDSVSAITDTTATCGGEVSDDGGAAVTARGVCWSTSSNPTLADNFTVDGSGLGVFVSNLTGLTPNTNYFVRAYATNSVGTAYGNEFDFMTLWTHCPGIPTITYEGQIYNTVLIGTQCWLKENLNVGSMIPGSQDMMDNSLIEKYCYNDEIDSCDVYGGLYQWNEVMQYTTTPGVQGICPPGWHIPTDEEWKQLEGEVDSQYGYPDPEWDNIEFRGFDAGKNLKTTSGWFNNGNGTDDYGFSALPGGYRYYAGNFYNLGKTATFWSATEFNSSRVWARGLGYGNDEAGRSYYSKGYGFSLRCLKD